MSDRAFFDTNVLVYAFDRGDSRRQRIAAELLETALKAGTGVLSLQVLQEFYVVTTRKIRVPLSPALARSTVVDLLRFHVVEPTAVHVLQAMDLAVARSLSYWDALIVVTADSASCSVLYSEDMSHGSALLRLRIENPFR